MNTLNSFKPIYILNVKPSIVGGYNALTYHYIDESNIKNKSSNLIKTITFKDIKTEFYVKCQTKELNIGIKNIVLKHVRKSNISSSSDDESDSKMISIKTVKAFDSELFSFNHRFDYFEISCIL